jgi:lysophospholipase L1-like esterase
MSISILFTPHNLTPRLLTNNLIMDVEPNVLGLANNDPIVELSNSIVGQNEGVQAVGANRAIAKTNQQNGKSAAYFDGTNDNYSFGNIFDGLTQGSFYFIGRKTSNLPGVLVSGTWQTEVTSGAASFLGNHDGTGNKVRERMFRPNTIDSPYIGEAISDQYFLYEVHASGTNWENILNEAPLDSTGVNVFTAPSGFKFGDSWGIFYEGYVLRMLGYSAAHDAAQRAQTREFLQSYYDADFLDHYTSNYIFVGDSITASFPYAPVSLPENEYPFRTLEELGGSNFRRFYVGVEYSNEYRYYDRRLSRHGRNDGVGGDKITDVIARAATTDGYYDSSVARNVLVLLAGTNDLSNLVPAATVQANIQSYCLARQAAGWEVYVGTIMPRTDFSIEPDRTTVNTWLRANYTNFATGLIDFASDSRLDDSTDVVYYADLVHPTAAGYAAMGEIAAAVIG